MRRALFKKIVRGFRIPIATLLFVLVVSALPVFATTVTFRVADVQGQAGGTVDVPITAVAAPGLSAVHLELNYDPHVVTPDTVTRGTLAGNNSLIDFNAAQAGRLLIGVATLDAIKGDGPLAIARFKVAGERGATSALTLDNSRAWETGAHAEVLVRTEPGKVTIVNGFPFFLLVVAAICLAILLILILILVLRKGRRRTPQPVQQQAAPAPPGRPGDPFRSAEDKYLQLKGRLGAGRMTQQQFEAAMREVMIQDAYGRYWTIDMHTGRWLVYDGQAWVVAQPY